MRYSDIENAEAALEQMRRSFLRERGWQHTCNNAANLWLWVKTIDRLEYRCHESTALYIEAHKDCMESDEADFVEEIASEEEKG